MQGLKRLEKLRELNENPAWVNDDLYRLMYKDDLYKVAYEKIKSKPGNMTPGTDDETLDGMEVAWVESTIQSMRNESFQFHPGRLVNIPKHGGGTRTLTIGSPRDKIVQEVIRMILESIYDSPRNPTFLDVSHGFRAGFGTHTALKEVRGWNSGVNWIVDGDIKGFFDNVDHNVLVHLLRERISDERFLNLIWKALKSGAMKENGVPSISLSGTPQGSVLSPILANIYLHGLDLFVMDLKAWVDRGRGRRKNPEYANIQRRIERLRKQDGNPEEISQLRKRAFEIPAMMPDDPEFLRLHYARYADDWIIGVTGPKALAEEVKEQVEVFLQETLKLSLNQKKIKIRRARSEASTFLGTEISVDGSQKFARVQRGEQVFKKRSTGHLLKLKAPLKTVVARLAEKGFCTKEGKPLSKDGLLYLSEVELIQRYNSVLQGILNYYSFVDNRERLSRVQYILQNSAAKTLANRRRLSARKKVFKRLGPSLRVTEMRADGKPITAELSLHRDWSKKPSRFLTKSGGGPDGVVKLVERQTRSLLGAKCCICGAEEASQMHHVKHVKKMGEKVVGFHRVMSVINRKQLPVCKDCHNAIHTGKYDGLKLSDLAYIPQ